MKPSLILIAILTLCFIVQAASSNFRSVGEDFGKSWIQLHKTQPNATESKPSLVAAQKNTNVRDNSVVNNVTLNNKSLNNAKANITSSNSVTGNNETNGDPKTGQTVNETAHAKYAIKLGSLAKESTNKPGRDLEKLVFVCNTM